MIVKECYSYLGVHSMGNGACQKLGAYSYKVRVQNL